MVSRVVLFMTMVALVSARAAPAEAEPSALDGARMLATHSVPDGSGIAALDPVGRWRWISYEVMSGPRMQAAHATVSRDGTVLAFSAPGPLVSEIYAMSTWSRYPGGPMASVPAKLTAGVLRSGELRGDSRDPAISFAGNEVAFANSASGSPGDSQIRVVGGLHPGARRLTWATHNETPAFSPDGTLIAYTAYPANAAGGLPRVFVMDSLYGTGKRKLSILPGSHPAWSPDGTRLAFAVEGCGPANACGIATVRSDGSQLRQITRAPSADRDAEPAFSPDGTRIAFSRRTAGAGNHWQLHTVRSDGSDDQLYAGDDVSDWTNPSWVTPGI